jgi:hypothetical protein
LGAAGEKAAFISEQLHARGSIYLRQALAVRSFTWHADGGQIQSPFLQRSDEIAIQIALTSWYVSNNIE